MGARRRRGEWAGPMCRGVQRRRCRGWRTWLRHAPPQPSPASGGGRKSASPCSFHRLRQRQRPCVSLHRLRQRAKPCASRLLPPLAAEGKTLHFPAHPPLAAEGKTLRLPAPPPLAAEGKNLALPCSFPRLRGKAGMGAHRRRGDEWAGRMRRGYSDVDVVVGGDGCGMPHPHLPGTGRSRKSQGIHANHPCSIQPCCSPAGAKAQARWPCEVSMT